MNRFSRMLLISGLGVVAGVTIGAGPAMAATSTSQGAAATSSSAVQVRPGDQLIGYFNTRFECARAGAIGERFGRWDDWNCYRVRGGWHEDDWALVVQSNDWHHGWPGHHHGWPGHHHGWPGGHDGWPGGHDDHGDHGDHSGHDDGHHGH